MHIICLVKFIPAVEHFQYDYVKNILVRENVGMVINPDDACALAFALKLKKQIPGTTVEVVSMAPFSVLDKLRDLLRRKADSGVLISDKRYAGSDTYVTATIFARYLERANYDLILTGTHSLDGDTAHIPMQVAELLGLGQMVHVVKIDDVNLKEHSITVQTEFENECCIYCMDLPAVVGVSTESGLKLPFVKYEDLTLDVDDHIRVVSNKELGFSPDEVGLSGSPTKVAATYPSILKEKERIVVDNTDDGIETVYRFLVQKGFVPYE